MKRKLLLCLILAFTLLVSAIGLAACGNQAENDADVKTTEIYAVYKLYAASEEEKGHIPLSYEQWLILIKGEKGDQGLQGEKGEQGERGADGTNGKDGENGTNGKSAYEIWLDNGHTGTESDFLEWLKGENGEDGTNGKSAYEIWINAGYEGSENDFLVWLKTDLENPQGLNFYLLPDDTYAVSIGHAKYLKNISIPATYKNKAVTVIESYGFCPYYIENMDCELPLESIVIPDSVKVIDDDAFFRCPNLTSVIIGNSVINIGYNAFAFCSSLTSIVIPDSVKVIDDYAFYQCTSLNSLTFGNNSRLETIGEYAFASCDLEDVQLPENVDVGNGAFSCGIEKVALITLHGSDSTYDKNFIDAFKTACNVKGISDYSYAIVSDISESRECYLTILNLVDQGYKHIFADSFGHEDYMIQAAKDFPDVQFYHATGYKAQIENLENYHNAFASIYEGRYLAGYAAGLKLLTMTDKAVNGNFQLGYVGAFTYAEVISAYSAFYLGVKAALAENPVNDVTYTATMDVTFTGSWYDETYEQEAAQALIAGGAVLVSQHADSMGAPIACDEKNVPNVAYNGSTNKSTLVAYSKINWVPYFEKMIEQAKGGAKVETDWTGTIATGSVEWALGNCAAEGTQAKVKAIETQLINGTRKVFDCSKFTVNGTALTTADGNVKQDATTGIVYFAESESQSAPYFDLEIDGITILDVNYGV